MHNFIVKFVLRRRRLVLTRCRHLEGEREENNGKSQPTDGDDINRHAPELVQCKWPTMHRSTEEEYISEDRDDISEVVDCSRYGSAMLKEFISCSNVHCRAHH